MRTSVFPVRPFLVIGILAGVRDILSASARLTLSGTLSKAEFNDTLIALGVGVGVVVFLCSARTPALQVATRRGGEGGSWRRAVQ